MHRAQEQVRDFMRAMGQPTPLAPCNRLMADRMQFRLRLIQEEAKELSDAVDAATSGIPSHRVTNVTADQVDALCDLLYVTYGMAIEMGVDIDPFWELVHEANMKKGPGPVREDGKKLKPEGWKSPDIEGQLQRQFKQNA